MFMDIWACASQDSLELLEHTHSVKKETANVINIYNIRWEESMSTTNLQTFYSLWEILFFNPDCFLLLFKPSAYI